jgi:hypothetical protein
LKGIGKEMVLVLLDVSGLLRERIEKNEDIWVASLWAEN